MVISSAIRTIILFGASIISLIFFQVHSSERVLAQNITPPLTGAWNGFNDHLNIVECSNASAHSIDLTLSAFDNSAALIGTHDFTLAAGTTEHINLNAYPVSMKYGTYQVSRRGGAESSAVAVNCTTVIYRMASADLGKAVEYAYAIPALDPLTEVSAGVYNSMNPGGAAIPVYNWLSLYNPGSESFSAEIEIYTTAEAAPAQLIQIADLWPGERRDFALGHEQGQIVGLYRILPSDPSQPYGAFLTRYAAGNSGAFDFAFPLLALPGSCDPAPVHLSTMDPATNWVELANPDSDPVQIDIELRTADNSLLLQQTITLPAFSQHHLYANQYLGERSVGMLRARCSAGSVPAQRFLVQSLFYGHPGAGSPHVEWAYASQGSSSAAASGARLAAPLNTYLGAANWAKLRNAVGEAISVTPLLFRQDSSGVYQQPSTVLLTGTADLPLHEHTGTNTVGFALLSADISFAAADNRAFALELLRVFPKDSGGIGYIVNMRSALIPTAIDPAQPLPFRIWQPQPGTSWQWNLDGPIDTSVNAQVFDLDLFDTGSSVISALHAQNRSVICYLSAGTWEDWRPDAAAFPLEVLGESWPEWPGERWLDIRRLDLLGPIMRARLDLCKAKGFDAVEPDNIDGYDSETGFPITYNDQLLYNRWLADEAHLRGLSIGLKNNSAQVADLLAQYDWALTEDCFHDGWCSDVLPFVEAGKAVFAAEYTDTGTTLQDFCPQAIQWNIDAILKNRGLDAARWACR